ncbi:hypothetical protein Save01_06538 [Streptomyces avermitilis]
MKRRLCRRCGQAPGALSPEDQAASISSVRCSPPCATGALDPRPLPGPRRPRGPFVERAHPRPSDDHGPDIIAVALQHPGGSYTPYGERYRELGWLRCETDSIHGAWNPAYAPLTHAAAGLDLPAVVGMAPANYGVHVEARRPDNTGYTLLRLGPYNQTGSLPATPIASTPSWRAARPPSAPGSRSPRRPRRSTSATTRATTTRTRPMPPCSWRPLSPARCRHDDGPVRDRDQRDRRRKRPSRRMPLDPQRRGRGRQRVHRLPRAVRRRHRSPNDDRPHPDRFVFLGKSAC